jgi:exosome complex component RRP42
MKFLSPTERLYIGEGVEKGIRSDGRSRDQFRPYSLTVDCIPQANGSARIQVQKGCDILIGIRLDLGTPTLEAPTKGKIICNVDCSTSTALNEIENRSFREINTFLAQTLEKLVVNSLNLEDLCILAEHHCWLVYLDVLVLEFNGNLLSCAMKALKSALKSLKIPQVSVTAIELEADQKEASEFALEIDQDNYTQLVMHSFPELITFNLISTLESGDLWFVDGTMQEELAAREQVHVAVDEAGRICFVDSQGKGALSPDSLIGLLESAKVFATSSL